MVADEAAVVMVVMAEAVGAEVIGLMRSLARHMADRLMASMPCLLRHTTRSLLQ